jgi:LPXTG-motif cell wall-anchored protein
VFVSYWDTAGVRVGTYETEVSINYGDKSSKKSLQFDVEENELIIIGLGYVISEDGGESNTLMFVLIGVIVLLVLVNILWFFLFRKKFKR